MQQIQLTSLSLSLQIFLVSSSTNTRSTRGDVTVTECDNELMRTLWESEFLTHQDGKVGWNRDLMSSLGGG